LVALCAKSKFRKRLPGGCHAVAAGFSMVASWLPTAAKIALSRSLQNGCRMVSKQKITVASIKSTVAAWSQVVFLYGSGAYLFDDPHQIAVAGD
jgi:hypothetical protein